MDAQVLIALLFGDKLNPGNIEFELEGGAAFSTNSTFQFFLSFPFVNVEGAATN